MQTRKPTQTNVKTISSAACLLVLHFGISTAFPAALKPIASVRVPASGEAVAFKTNLNKGEMFLLKASGAVALGKQKLDAEYCADASGAADKVGDVDVGIDTGVKEILPATGRKPAPPSTNRAKWFGNYRADHVYYLLVTGAGTPLSLKLLKPAGSGAGSGIITVSLFPLTPATVQTNNALETVMVPAREKISVYSKLTGDSNAVYLLQAAGEIQVGGPGHMGDAEFDDYHPDGTGYNEGEGGVDFGVGVDEPVVGAGHDPRKFKWGQYRMDHIYYMLYAGTGKPIGLNYHDTGGKSGVYMDNAGYLPVRIFRLP